MAKEQRGPSARGPQKSKTETLKHYEDQRKALDKEKAAEKQAADDKE